MTRYRDVLDDLRNAYDGGAARRDAMAKEPWKVAEREAFAARFASGSRVLEVGAGPGHDSAWFAGQGLDVVATDLSPEMVARCRAKGLDAHTMDFLSLDFPEATFDGVYGFNCFLHVPNDDLPDVLASVARVLRPQGILFVGNYGGDSGEGLHEGDWHDPPRYFAWRTDDELRAAVAERFEIVDFHVVGAADMRFQSLTARKA